MSHREKAAELVRLCDSKLVAITNGHEPSILATPDKVCLFYLCRYIERYVNACYTYHVVKVKSMW